MTNFINKPIWRHFAKVFCVMIWAIICGCSKNNKPTNINGVVARTGTYYLEPENDRLEVMAQKNEIILVLTSGKPATFCEGASIFSRWGIYWDKKKQRLWFHSSDVGIFVYERSGNGEYSRSALTVENAMLFRIPRPFFEILPNSIKIGLVPE